MNRIRILLAVVLLGAVASPLQAFTIYYDSSRDSALRECDQMNYVGDYPAARACFDALEDHPNLHTRANAGSALGHVRAANRLYRDAASDNSDPAIKTSWGRLYLQTHQVSDAISLFREALLQDENYLPARLGLAEATMQTFEGRARAELRDITANHPDNIKALVLLARIELELGNLDVARGLLDSALALANEQGLPPLEMYALHAGANLLEANPIDEWVDKALEYNPNYGDAYSIIAHYYIITYRYREAVDLYQKAIRLDPQLASAHRDLGINYLRINNIFASRYHVKKAFELDAFDTLTVNTLRLLDKLDGMRLTKVDVPDPADSNRTLGRVLIRLDTEDVNALEPYVIDLATRAVQTFTQRYNFRLKQPMIVELFHDHDDFGVRTVSTPGIGLLGVTFGYLTAMDSPKARAAGEFHWGSTLWHEIAHVFTLEATNHLLPRWLSEGLSVYEEWNTGPLNDRSIAMDTLVAIAKGDLLPIAELDSGFVRPAYQGQVQVSYTQAGLICDYISLEWGHDALVTLLYQYGAGASTEDALLAAIDMTPDEFDAQFGEHIESRYGVLAQDLDAYQVTGRQLGRAIQAEDWISVEALARSMIRRDPERAGDGNAYEVLAKALTEQGKPEQALDTMLNWHSLGGHNPGGLQKLIRELRERGRDSQAAMVMESLNWVNPYVVEEHKWLGEYYLDSKNPQRAIREFDALLGLQAEDPADAYLGKARAAVQVGDELLAKRQVLQALENAPFYRQAQQLLLELNQGEQLD